MTSSVSLQPSSFFRVALGRMTRLLSFLNRPCSLTYLLMWRVTSVRDISVPLATARKPQSSSEILVGLAKPEGDVRALARLRSAFSLAFFSFSYSFWATLSSACTSFRRTARAPTLLVRRVRGDSSATSAAGTTATAATGAGAGAAATSALGALATAFGAAEVEEEATGAAVGAEVVGAFLAGIRLGDVFVLAIILK